MKNFDELIHAFTQNAKVKTGASFSNILVLSILAGMYIGFGAIFYTLVVALSPMSGVTQILGGLAFSLGLILVVIAKAELFTGSHLNIISTLNRELCPRALIKNWTLIFAGNFFGSLLLVFLFFLSGKYLDGDFAIGLKFLSIAETKISLTFVEAFSRAILCNILVCLAVWMAASSDNVVGKVAAIIFPISGFVAMGFEHSVANMFFIPMGIVIKNFVPEVGGFHDGNIITTTNFLIRNLLPVTLGNMVGGVFFVGTAYWFVSKDSE